MFDEETDGEDGFFDGEMDPVGFPTEVNFVHKRIGGAIKGFVTSGFNPIGAVTGFLAPPSRPAPVARPTPRFQGFPTDVPIGRGPTPFAPDRGCILPFRTAPDGSCKLFLGDRPGPDRPTGTDVGPADIFGEAVIGAFGMAALVPAVVGEINGRPIRRCPRGAVLGKFDNLCYQKGSISNKNRKWPAAKRPPVSVGDGVCITRAKAAKGRVKRLAKNVGFKVTG